MLELLRELKLLRLGLLSPDGTRIRANASKDQSVNYRRAQQLHAQLRQEVHLLLQQAEQADQKDEAPQKLPADIARREALRQKMDQAYARREERAKAEKAELQRPTGSGIGGSAGVRPGTKPCCV